MADRGKAKPIRVLVVGAGAVGQVYGRHLHAGGATVTFLVKPAHLKKLSRPFRLYPLNVGHRTEGPLIFDDFEMVSDISDEAVFDQVWLCVSSTALRQGWFPRFAAKLGDATLVSLLPGLQDRDFLLQYVPEEQLVTGLISLISYQAPLPGEMECKPGIAFWFPPASPTPLSGPDRRRDQAVTLLRAGKQPVKVHRDVGALSGFPTAVLMPLLVGLEASDWTFEGFRRGPYARLSLEGVSEALAIVSAHQNLPTPYWGRLLGRVSLRTALWLAPRIVPLPLEAYLQYHFTKVGAQTRFFIDAYIEIGLTHGLSTAALSVLRASIRD